MKSFFRKTFAALTLLTLLGCQSTPASVQAPPVRSPGSNVPSGEPYEEDEFPEFLKDLYRAEVVGVGTFPFAYLMSNLVYDYVIYFQRNSDPRFLPWPGGTGTGSFTGGELNDKNTTLITASVVISLGVALLDWLLGLGEKKAP